MSAYGKKTTAVLLTIGFILSGVLPITGCQKKEKEIKRRPRPVNVITLSKDSPPEGSYFTATVASWKTEQIGFEVGGRVEMVVEPNTEILAREAQQDSGEDEAVDAAPDADKPAGLGTKDQESSDNEPDAQDDDEAIRRSGPRRVIARLESERYELAVEKAKAEKVRAEQNLAAAKIERDKSLPQQIAAAEAKFELAEIELRRSKTLEEQDAGAQADVDLADAQKKDAAAQIEILKATVKAKEAEIISLENSVAQAASDLRDAKRNLQDCKLYASFNGQVADVMVVPGSVVQAGTPAVTLQMMDPIKIEIEVSAELSRRLKRTDLVPVSVTLPNNQKYKKVLADGSEVDPLGYLYLIDQVADPLTRTFTVTLLLENGKMTPRNFAGIRASTSDIWGLDFKFLPGRKEGELFVEERAILKDEKGHYLWLITNLSYESSRNKDDFFKVEKLRVKKEAKKITWLADWVFQQISLVEPDFEIDKKAVIGELRVSEGTPEEWNGDTVYRDSDQWYLWPGDLIEVDLEGSHSSMGYYVPMEAIVRENGQSFIFYVKKTKEGSIAKRMEVIVDPVKNEATSPYRRIRKKPSKDDSKNENSDDEKKSDNDEEENTDEGPPLEGLQLIYEGAHYLKDGEEVVIAEDDDGDSSSSDEGSK